MDSMSIPIRVEHHHYFHTLHDEGQGQHPHVLAEILAIVRSTQREVHQMARTAAEILQNLADMREINKQFIEYIAKSDAEKAALRQAATDAIARANLSDEQKAALQTDMDAVFDASETTENEMRAGLPGVPPVGGSGLVASYADKASFDAAAAAYTGPEAVTLDGAEVKAGTAPALDYFTHSADGHIDTAGPTD